MYDSVPEDNEMFDIDEDTDNLIVDLNSNKNKNGNSLINLQPASSLRQINKRKKKT